jgi:hypothetical protein
MARDSKSLARHGPPDRPKGSAPAWFVAGVWEGVSQGVRKRTFPSPWTMWAVREKKFVSLGVTPVETNGVGQKRTVTPRPALLRTPNDHRREGLLLSNYHHAGNGYL